MFHHVNELCNSQPFIINKKTGKQRKQASKQASRKEYRNTEIKQPAAFFGKVLHAFPSFCNEKNNVHQFSVSAAASYSLDTVTDL